MANLTGRNNSVFFEKDGKRFIKKQLIGEPNDVKRRYNNLILWDQILRLNKEINSPVIESKDDDSYTVVYKWLEGSENLQDKVSNTSIESVASDIYKATELLKKINSLNIQDFEMKKKPRKEKISPLIALTEGKYINSTGGELELFALLQHDNFLKGHIFDNNKSNSNQKNEGIRHGDMRLDQFIVTPDNKVWIVDFEEFGYGNKLADVAGILGSILFDVLYKTFSSIDMEIIDENEVNRQFMNNGERNLNNVKPVMEKVYRIYTDEFITSDAKEIARLIGWFLIERIMSRAQFTFRLSDVDKAIAGVGRQAVLEPDSVLDLLL